MKVLAAIALAAVAYAQPLQYDVTFLNGSYAYRISGIAIDPIYGSSTAIAEAGRLTADGAGNVNGADTVIVAGSLVRRTFVGTYSINPDGTGAFVLNPSWGPQIHADFVAGEHGKLLTLVITDSGNTLSGAMEVQQPATPLTGGYNYNLAGTAMDFYGNVTPIREIGHLVSDGAGNLTGTSTVSINGSIVRRTLTGTYTMNPDGTGSATLYPSWGPPIDVDLFVSANGVKVEFVVTDSGSTLSGSMVTDTLPSERM